MVWGAGWEDLLWASQLQFIGSVACGLGLLLALQGPRSRRTLLVAAALLTASLMFSGVGLFFGVAATVQLAATPERRRDIVWLAPVAVALGAWFLAFGRAGSTSTAFSFADIAILPLYVAWGLGSSAGGLIGVSGIVGLAVFVLAAWAVAAGWRRRGVDGFSLGGAAGPRTFSAGAGLLQVQFGYPQTGARPYT